MAALLNRKSKIVYGVYVLIALTIWFLGFHEMPEIVDVNEYKLYAKSISESVSVFTESDRWLENTRRTPFYPFLIYLDHSLIFLRILQLFSWLCFPLISIKLYNKINRTQYNLSHWIIVLTSLIPLGYYYSFITIPDILTGLFLGIWILFSLDKKFFQAAITSAVLIGLKPIFIFTLILIPFFSASHYKKWILAQLLVVLAMAAMLFFNYYRTNRWELSSVSTTNLYDYNRKLVLSKTLGVASTDSIYESEHKDIINSNLNEAEIAKYLRKKSIGTILEYPLTYAYLHVKGMITTLIDPGRFDAMVYWGWERSKGFLNVNDGHSVKKRPWFEWLYVIGFLIINLLRSLLMCLGFWNYRNDKEILWIFSLLLVYLFLIGPVGSARYIIPIIIPVISVSVIGLSTIKNKSKSSV